MRADQIPGVRADQIPGVKADQIPGVRADQIPGVKADQIPGVKADQIPGPGGAPDLVPSTGPATIPDPRRPGAAGRPGWISTVTITPWRASPCTHEGETTAYQPPPSLRHLIHIRQATCSHPGCRRPAVRCDLDHTIAHGQGGRTCWCNLAPLCRGHHDAKQTPGWTLTQDQPGTMAWVTPSHRTYTTHPTNYPD